MAEPCGKCGGIERYKSGRCKPCRLAAGRRYRQENSKKIREKDRRYYQKNLEKIQAARRQWRQENPEKARVAEHKRRANKAKVPQIPYDFKAIRAHYGNICLRCKRPKDLTIDHVLPISRGGADTSENIQPLCQSCNSAKGVHATDYRPDKGLQSQQLEIPYGRREMIMSGAREAEQLELMLC